MVQLQTTKQKLVVTSAALMAAKAAADAHVHMDALIVVLEAVPVHVKEAAKVPAKVDVMVLALMEVLTN